MEGVSVGVRVIEVDSVVKASVSSVAKAPASSFLAEVSLENSSLETVVGNITVSSSVADISLKATAISPTEWAYSTL
jgi:hypothetical protein